MSIGDAFPAGLTPPIYPQRTPPQPPLYFSELVAPTRSLAWLVEVDADNPVVTAAELSILHLGNLYNPIAFGTTPEVDLNTVTHRFATRPFVTSATDAPASTPVEGRSGPVLVARYLEVSSSGYYSSLATSTAGEVVLRNDDGRLDDLLGSSVVTGREIRLSVAGLTRSADGREQQPELEDFSQLFAGTIASLDWGRTQLRLAISDENLQFARSVQDVSYNGGGGINGQPDLAGVTKPLCYGKVLNATPALLDPYLRTFQFHDGEARAVDAVYDSGVPLELHSTVQTYDELVAVTVVDPTVAGDSDFTVGKYVACPAEGCFRLGGLTAGRVTADVRGYGSNDAAFEFWDDGTLWDDGTGWEPEGGLIHAHTVAEVAVVILRRAGIRNIDERQFRQLDNDEPREVGLYLEPGGSKTVDECLRLLLQSNGCFLSRSGDGIYQLQRLDVPKRPSFTMDMTTIVAGSLRRVPLPWRQPWSRWRVRHSYNWTVMSDSELVDAVDPSKRTFLQREAGEAEVVDDAAVIIYPARSPAVVDTALVREEDAKGQAARLMALYSLDTMVQFRSKGVGFRGELGRTVRVIYDRFGLEAGLDGIITSIREDGTKGETEFIVLG